MEEHKKALSDLQATHQSSQKEQAQQIRDLTFKLDQQKNQHNQDIKTLSLQKSTIEINFSHFKEEQAQQLTYLKELLNLPAPTFADLTERIKPFVRLEKEANLLAQQEKQLNQHQQLAQEIKGMVDSPVDLINYEENDLGDYDNIEIKFKSGKKQRTKPANYEEPTEPDKRELFLKREEIILFFNNSTKTPNLLDAETIYLEDLRVYGIRHLTSKKEERQNNPEIELNEAQFIALERDKRRERQKSIKEFENKKGCLGKHILTYGTSFEQREEKALEIKEMEEQEEDNEVEPSQEKYLEIKK
ncbi:9042_t:CDS:2 [Funneliformis geosporum]|uniref:9042_t:CDS:1 n=1 Tax=Funneliformis geosporum TaxID=1117311 RepID=A0A9W4T5J9_9GLOM|nr:9042_t:CDS:2 [Funneliformis geosporum]